jgi:hypothetical protein
MECIQMYNNYYQVYYNLVALYLQFYHYTLLVYKVA